MCSRRDWASASTSFFVASMTCWLLVSMSRFCSAWRSRLWRERSTRRWSSELQPTRIRKGIGVSHPRRRRTVFLMPASPKSEQSEQQPLQRPAEPDLANKGHDCPQQHERARGQGHGSNQIGFSFRGGGRKKRPHGSRKGESRGELVTRTTATASSY